MRLRTCYLCKEKHSKYIVKYWIILDGWIHKVCYICNCRKKTFDNESNGFKRKYKTLRNYIGYLELKHKEFREKEIKKKLRFRIPIKRKININR